MWFILPIIPAGVELRDDSKLTKDHLGKIPGKYTPELNQWGGFYGWQGYQAKQRDLERWQGWQTKCETGIAIGLRLGIFLACDIDCDDMALAAEIEIRVTALLGMPFAVRRRHDSARRVMFYVHKLNVTPITKSRIAFEILETGEKCIVEFLGYGQQVVIEGPHAKGDMHYWQNSVGLIEGLEEGKKLPLEIHDVDKMMRGLKDWIEVDDRLELIKAKLPIGGVNDAAVAVSDLMSPALRQGPRAARGRGARDRHQSPVARSL
jgi:hypothetical protein